MYKFDWRDYLDRNNRAILDLGITEDMLEDIPDQLIRASIVNIDLYLITLKFILHTGIRNSIFIPRGLET